MVAGVGRGEGIDGTLRSLRDAGVYVAYEEFHGAVPDGAARPPSSSRRTCFLNPGVRGEYTTSTGASRSARHHRAVSFDHVRRARHQHAHHRAPVGPDRVPHAVWFPALRPVRPPRHADLVADRRPGRTLVQPDPAGRSGRRRSQAPREHRAAAGCDRHRRSSSPAEAHLLARASARLVLRQRWLGTAGRTSRSIRHRSPCWL